MLLKPDEVKCAPIGLRHDWPKLTLLRVEAGHRTASVETLTDVP